MKGPPSGQGPRVRYGRDDNSGTRYAIRRPSTVYREKYVRSRPQVFNPTEGAVAQKPGLFPKCEARSSLS